MPAPSQSPISPSTREFGRRVAARRQELGLSQEKAADAIGVHWTYLGQVERGRRNVTLHNILKIAYGLGIGVEDLVRDLPAPVGESELRTEPNHDLAFAPNRPTGRRAPQPTKPSTVQNDEHP